MMFVTAQHLSVLLLRFLGHELILRGAHDLKWSSCFERVQSDLLSRSPVGLTSAVSILISGENVSRLHTQSPPPPPTPVELWLLLQQAEHEACLRHPTSWPNQAGLMASSGWSGSHGCWHFVCSCLVSWMKKAGQQFSDFKQRRWTTSIFSSYSVNV